MTIRRITATRAFKVAANIVTTTALLAGMTLADADARQARSLTTSMTGMWGWTAQSCRIAGDDGQIVIKARSVEFFAASYSLENIVVRADGVFHATAITHEEGEPGASKGHVDLKLVADDRLSIRTDAAGSHPYVRCR